MKARYSYPLLFALPSAIASVIAGAFFAASGAGAMWIFVYGDNPWPPYADTLLVTGTLTFALAALIGLLVFSYHVGKAEESRGGLRRAHIILALGLTVGLPLLVLIHQWQVGNLGHSPVPPDSSMPISSRP